MGMSEHNAKVRRYHEKIKVEGLKCKNCAHESKDYRLVDPKYGLSKLTCKKCEHDVIVSENPWKPKSKQKKFPTQKKTNEERKYHIKQRVETLAAILFVSIGFCFIFNWLHIIRRFGRYNNMGWT